MQTIKITVGLTVTAELSVYDPRIMHYGLGSDVLLSLQDRLLDLMRRAALDAATREGLEAGSYTVRAIETLES